MNMECWNFHQLDYRVKLFILDLKLFSAETKKWIDYSKVIVDTGYDGDLLIPYTDFINNGFLSRLNYEKGFYIAETISGTMINLMSSFSEIQISNQKITILVETFPQNTEILLGRGILRKSKWVIDGLEEKFCNIDYYS